MSTPVKPTTAGVAKPTAAVPTVAVPTAAVPAAPAFQSLPGSWQHLEAEIADRVLVLRPKLGMLASHSDVDALRAEMTEVVRSNPSRLYVLDMVRVNFISSAFLGALTDINKKFRAAGVPFRIHSLRPEIAKVLHATKLDKLLAIRRDLAEALQTD